MAIHIRIHHHFTSFFLMLASRHLTMTSGRLSDTLPPGSNLHNGVSKLFWPHRPLHNCSRAGHLT